MACGIEKIFCGREDYCELGLKCKKVNSEIRKILEKTRPQPSAIKVAIFELQGSGENCTRRD